MGVRRNGRHLKPARQLRALARLRGLSSSHPNTPPICSRKRGKTRQVDGALLTIEQPYSGKTELMGEDQLYAPSLRKPYPVTEINPLESLAERVARRLQPKYPY